MRKEANPITLLSGHSDAVLEVQKASQILILLQLKQLFFVIPKVLFHESQPDHLFSCSRAGEMFHWNGSAANRVAVGFGSLGEFLSLYKVKYRIYCQNLHLDCFRGSHPTPRIHRLYLAQQWYHKKQGWETVTNFTVSHNFSTIFCWLLVKFLNGFRQPLPIRSFDVQGTSLIVGGDNEIVHLIENLVPWFCSFNKRVLNLPILRLALGSGVG